MIGVCMGNVLINVKANGYALDPIVFNDEGIEGVIETIENQKQVDCNIYIYSFSYFHNIQSYFSLHWYSDETSKYD